MNHGKSRSGLMGVVGLYLLYTAYQLYQGWDDPNTTMSHPVMLIFIILFAAVAAVLLVWSCKLWKQANDEEAEKRGDEENGLK